MPALLSCAFSLPYLPAGLLTRLARVGRELSPWWPSFQEVAALARAWGGGLCRAPTRPFHLLGEAATSDPIRPNPTGSNRLIRQTCRQPPAFLWKILRTPHSPCFASNAPPAMKTRRLPVLHPVLISAPPRRSCSNLAKVFCPVFAPRLRSSLPMHRCDFPALFSALLAIIVMGTSDICSAGGVIPPPLPPSRPTSAPRLVAKA